MAIGRKEKPCKATGRASGFDGCGEITDRHKYGLCPKCLYKWSKQTEEGKEWFERQVAFTKKRNEKERKRKERKLWEEKKEAMKSIQALIQDARKPFQKWIRFRDANDGCISCDAPTASEWHAGHYYKAELYTDLIFNEVNCNKQCNKCNIFLDGNESGYRQGLLKKYGREAVEQLDRLAAESKKTTKKVERDYPISIKKKYKELLKENGIK